MAFELNIAVKRSPIEQPGREGTSPGTPSAVTIVEVTGELSSENAVDLTQRLEDVVAGAPTSLIIRFVGDVRVSPDDEGPIGLVAAWLKRKRSDGYSLYVEVPDAQAREAFMRVEDMKAAMLPLGADPSVPRRNVEEPSSGIDGTCA
jgi:hypothetical protein